MKKLLWGIALLCCFACGDALAQSSGPNPPPPPVCSASNAGALYTATGTSPYTVYTCSYYNLSYQWVINPVYGGLVYYPTVPNTCTGALPMFLAGWPNTQVYVCVQGTPTLINSGSIGYPPAGVPNSTGSAWGTSYSVNGSGAGLSSGPSTSTNNDVTVFDGTSGQIEDSGVQITSLATLASPALTGVPTAPTASVGTDTTQLATTAFVLANGSGSGLPSCSSGQMVYYGSSGTTGTCLGVGTNLSITSNTLNASGSSSGVQYNPSTTNYVFTGGSRLIRATVVSTSPSAGTCNGTTCTLTVTNTYTTSDLIQFDASAGNFSPSCLDWMIAPVISATSSSVTVDENTGQGIPTSVGCTGNQTITPGSGVLTLADDFIPLLAAGKPFFNGHGTVYDYGIAGGTLSTMISNYSTWFHPLSPAVTGNLGFFFIDAGFNDASTGGSVATIEANYCTLWGDAEADGYKVVEMSDTPSLDVNSLTYPNASSVFMDVNQWLYSQSKNNSVGTCGSASDHWDLFIDLASSLNDFMPNLYGSAPHFSNSGTAIGAAYINQQMSTQDSLPANNPEVTSGSVSVGGSGFMSVDPVNNDGWWNAIYISGSTSLPVIYVGNIPHYGTVLDSIHQLSGGSYAETMIPSNGYCWNAGGAGTGPITASPDTCLTRYQTNGSGWVAVGTGAAYSGAGSLYFTGFLPATATAPTGVCSIASEFLPAKDGTLSWCDAGTWAAFGGGSGTVNSGTAYSPAYYASTGTAVSGTTPFTGFEYWPGSAAPEAAPATAVATLLSSLTGCSTAGYAYVPADGKCEVTTGSVNVNGSSVSSPNFNGSTPSADAGYILSTLKVSSSNVSIESPAGQGIAVGTVLAQALTTTTYMGIASSGLVSSTETSVQVSAPGPATLGQFYVKLSAAPGIGNSVAVTVRDNASSTAITCTVSTSATSCSDLTHTATVAAGDLLDISLVPSGTVVATPNIVTSLQWPNLAPISPTCTVPVQLVINNGTAATDAVPRFLSCGAVTVSSCKVLTTTSDASTGLAFNIYDNGTSIFSTSPTVSAATSPGTISSFSGFAAGSTYTFAVNDKLSMNITGGASDWVFTVKCQ